MADTDESRTPPAKRGKTAIRKSSPAQREHRPGGVRSGLALIVSLIALTVTGYLWYTLIYSRQEVLATDIIGTLKSLETRQQETRDNLSTVEADVVLMRESHEIVRAALERLQNEMIRNRTEWMIWEAERLLTIANHRLQLARDVPSALAALRAADRQLTQVADPELLAVRREIAHEISLLESFEKTDVAGITLRLANLAESVDRLPITLSAKREVPASAATADTAPSRGLWSDLLGLVHIRYGVENKPPLLAPEQQYFLRENLRLMLYGAQQAILQGNGATYRQNLQNARRWTKDYFDGQTQMVVGLQKDLDQLIAVKLAADLPSISGSLDTLRRIPSRRRAP